MWSCDRAEEVELSMVLVQLQSSGDSEKLIARVIIHHDQSRWCRCYRQCATNPAAWQAFSTSDSEKTAATASASSCQMTGWSMTRQSTTCDVKHMPVGPSISHDCTRICDSD